MPENSSRRHHCFSRLVHIKSSWEHRPQALFCMCTQWAIKFLCAYSLPRATAIYSLSFHLNHAQHLSHRTEVMIEIIESICMTFTEGL